MNISRSSSFFSSLVVALVLDFVSIAVDAFTDALVVAVLSLLVLLEPFSPSSTSDDDEDDFVGASVLALVLKPEEAAEDDENKELNRLSPGVVSRSFNARSARLNPLPLNISLFLFLSSLLLSFAFLCFPLLSFVLVD